MNKNKTLSIKDIARISGVSIATVSRVLNNKGGGYSERTAEKVRAVAESYGYISNMAAKSLRESKSNTIGLIIPNISNDFFSSLSLKIETYMEKNDYSVFICNTNNDMEKEKRYFKTLAGRGVDGIICASGMNTLSDDVIRNDIPVICIDRSSENGVKIPRIMNDEVHGGYMATKHLIENQCKHILYIGFYRGGMEQPIMYDDPRLEGYKKALKEKGIMLDYNYIVYSKWSASTSGEAEQIVAKFIKEGHVLDGIFAANDSLALGAVHAVMKAGKKIPEEIKIAGFDNSMYAQSMLPSITSVDRRLDELAEKGCQTMLNMINGQEIKEDTIMVPVELVVRESSCSE